MKQQHYDILIVGAGLSGIGTACHLAKTFPNKRLAILERRARIGGTWDLFRYPGIRSDSDMLSFGYKFRPWNATRVLADGPSIRQYIQDTAAEYNVHDKVHHGLRILSADWSTELRRWNLSAVHGASGERCIYSCNYLICCTGYYNHDQGFRPEFPGEDDFNGIKLHPQCWPEDLDYQDKKVLVIGSGATAVTLVPSMAKAARHVTMLQRSPSYIYSLPQDDKATSLLARILPGNSAYILSRKRNILLYRGLYLACRRWPRLMRRFLLSHMYRHAGPTIDKRHLTPAYMPWDERLCAVPNADFFKVLRSGDASIETGHIDRFIENGVRLKSGKELEADIIITATGLNLQMLGGMTLSIDGAPCPLSKRMTYKGVLLEGLPNMAWIFGYTNVSWTLKVDIAARYLCRLLKYMSRYQQEVVIPQDLEGNILEEEGILDSLASGYIKRGSHHTPRQGSRYPWRVLMHYGRDKKMLLQDSIDDNRLQFFSFRKDVKNNNKSERAAGATS
ncbi:monooxygenase, flavin-binding family [Alloalcanivorax xenomutans]|uniref:flavin-containing monooxygenase n=1 Tax=Alloalcanivorax xenomutans TaxID=1094342 RepID=UPI0006D5C76A|nr:NAD(P)/FAD-dependent oxidoreductase [Alloalcanivorax xenomutans]CUR46464.1 monooxygenase, flavin-binding family [Alloalcanivorax xenomutans]